MNVKHSNILVKNANLINHKKLYDYILISKKNEKHINNNNINDYDLPTYWSYKTNFAKEIILKIFFLYL